MPNLDKTGPQGKGEETGRGLGSCKDAQDSRGQGRGMGPCGQGAGRGRGMGRGFGRQAAQQEEEK